MIKISRIFFGSGLTFSILLLFFGFSNSKNHKQKGTVMKPSFFREIRKTTCIFSKSNNIKTVITVAIIHIFTISAFAQSSDPTTQIKDGIKKVVGLIMAIAFVSGIIIVMYGAKKKIDGEPGAYYSIVGGAILAMAPLIIGSLYYAFGQSAFVTQGEW